MVLVALVGLGLGMFQLFHLQKELAELREVSWHVDCGALEARGVTQLCHSAGVHVDLSLAQCFAILSSCLRNGSF